MRSWGPEVRILSRSLINMERSHSGLVHHVGNVAYRKVSRVQISPSPPSLRRSLWRRRASPRHFEATARQVRLRSRSFAEASTGPPLLRLLCLLWPIFCLAHNRDQGRSHIKARPFRAYRVFRGQSDPGTSASDGPTRTRNQTLRFLRSLREKSKPPKPCAP